MINNNNNSNNNNNNNSNNNNNNNIHNYTSVPALTCLGSIASTEEELLVCCGLCTGLSGHCFAFGLGRTKVVLIVTTNRATITSKVVSETIRPQVAENTDAAKTTDRIRNVAFQSIPLQKHIDWKYNVLFWRVCVW